MKPNFIDLSMTHDSENIKDLNEKINHLTNAIFPYVKNLIEDDTKDLDLNYSNDEINELSKDLSLAVACLWLDLKPNVQKDLIEKKPGTNKVIDDFNLITSRFYVKNDKTVDLIQQLYIESLTNKEENKNERKFKN